jgi:AcrR family transcriptional regulator
MALKKSTRKRRAPAKTVRRTNTRMRLIEAAERLFAQHGIDGVSSKQIIQAAKVGNESALQYHFGTRSALVDAIFEMRMSPINERRLHLLTELDQSGKPPAMRDIARILVEPLAGTLLQAVGRSFYCRFLERAQSSPEHVNVLVRRRHYSSVLGCAAHYRYLCPQLPRKIANLRMEIVLKTLGQGMADIERELAAVRPVGAKARNSVEIGNLIDCLVGILTAEMVDARPSLGGAEEE